MQAANHSRCSACSTTVYSSPCRSASPPDCRTGNVEQWTPSLPPRASCIQRLHPSAAAGPLKRAFNRIFTRHLMNIAILMALPVIFTVSLNPSRESMRDPDIWWHLADARQLTTTHHFIRTEPNSFTVGGQPWVNPEWLAELPYWFSYQALHLRGIYLAEWIIISANLVFLYWRGYRKSGHAGAAWWAAALAFLLISVNSGPRTISIAYLAMSSELAILDAHRRGNTRALWLLPPLFCVWVNLHGSWLIGLALFVLYILSGAFDFKKGAFEQEAFSSAERNRLLTVLGLCRRCALREPLRLALGLESHRHDGEPEAEYRQRNGMEAAESQHSCRLFGFCRHVSHGGGQRAQWAKMARVRNGNRLLCLVCGARSHAFCIHGRGPHYPYSCGRHSARASISNPTRRRFQAPTHSWSRLPRWSSCLSSPPRKT